LQSRAQLGADSELNLITLCVGCHNKLHSGPECPRFQVKS
jgi:cytochrome c553